MAGVVDADTHIAESEAMWRFIDSEMYPRRPVLAKIPDDTLYEERNAFWLIDGEIFPKPAGKASFSLITPSAQKKESGRTDIHLGVRELTDTMARLRDMDKIGVDVQVIYPTLFLVYLTDDPHLEAALCRAYNRFIANACATAPDRLKWAAILPLRDIEASLTEMRWAKEQGTVGVFFRGMEGNLTLDNPYFNPVYALAETRSDGLHSHGIRQPSPDATLRCPTQPHLCAQSGFAGSRVPRSGGKSHPGAVSQAAFRLHRSGGELGAIHLSCAAALRAFRPEK